MTNNVKKAKRTIKEFLENFIEVIRRPEMVFLPGNLAFSFVLAIIPTLGLITYGASMLNLSVDFMYNFIENYFSSEIADLVLGVNLSSIAGINFIISLLVGLYIASNGADSIITASNIIYGTPNKSWIKRRIKAFGLTFFLVILLIFSLIVPVFGNTIVAMVKEVNINYVITNRIIATFELLKGPISWLIIFVIIKAIYSLAPDKKPKNRVIDYGAVFTTLGWIIGTKIYSIYINNYSDYSVLYGSLASIVVLMIWIYFLSYIFTVGIALNSQKDENNLLKTGTIKRKDK